MNSLCRALCVRSADRALRVLALMRTRGLAPSPKTLLALVSGCAIASKVGVFTVVVVIRSLLRTHAINRFLLLSEVVY